MPYLKKFRKIKSKPKKKTYRKKKTNYIVNIPKTQLGFPKGMRTRLRYTDLVTFTGIGAYLLIKGNSLFDPTDASTGTTIGPLNEQPSWRDTYALIYQRYRVLSSTIKVEYTVNASLSSSIIILYPTDVSTAPTTTPYESSNVPYCKYKLLSYTNSSGKSHMMKSTMSTAKINGKEGLLAMTSDLYQSVSGSDPADLWYWILHSATIDATSVQNITCFIHIDYDVEFTDPILDRNND